ncbi:MAG TPA: hypothetical protein DCS43_15060 [Verrucomicrobia bacterium]|nr:hypothetical protein [Verrucomicrobiota bacterium]
MSVSLDRFNLFLVDMDDTLFEERDFVLSGLAATAAYTVAWGLDPSAAGAFLKQHFIHQGRERIFDHLLQRFLGGAQTERIQKLVEVYRQHRPDITMYDGAAEVLSQLRRLGRVIIVTDGLAAVQERKATALGLPPLVDQVVYCQGLGYAKPDPRSLDGIVTCGMPSALLIGDRPDHDLAMAGALGIASIRVRTGRFRQVANAPWIPLADLACFADLAGP